jgi:hypothetical protein
MAPRLRVRMAMPPFAMIKALKGTQTLLSLGGPQ